MVRRRTLTSIVLAALLAIGGFRPAIGDPLNKVGGIGLGVVAGPINGLALD